MDKFIGRKMEIDETLKRLAAQFSTGIRLDGPALGSKTLPSDMHIAGYQDDRPATKKAAVLIPIIRAGSTPLIVFTKRPEGMKEHPGQVSFPGGRMERGDHNLEETALREAREEIGLDPGKVEIVGHLAPYRTITRYEVTPIIGLVSAPFSPKPDPLEVEEVFEAPMGFFLDPRNLRQKSMIFQGKSRPYYYFDYDRFHIWGATAAMLINFREAVLDFTGTRNEP